MLQKEVLAVDPHRWLARHGGDRPVLFSCPAALSARHRAFRAGFAGQVSYAVKANPSEAVLAQLAAEGMTAFDVASPEEIETVARIAPGAALHYHNPVRGRAEIAAGVAAGVSSWSVDDPGELDKLIEAGAQGEAAVRLALPVGGAAYDFGAKFGAGPEAAAALLRRVAETGMTPALTFHVGTQCRAPGAWTAYMRAAAEVAGRAGIRIARLNVGGGFASARDGAVEHAPVFEAIRDGIRVFDAAPELICEPGRGLVADAFAHAVQVKSRRGDVVYLNDGIYGAFSEFPSIGVPRVTALGARGRHLSGALTEMIAWGPTCDSLDRVPGGLRLPGDIAEGDWLLFASMGAYVAGVSTRFNGYGLWDAVTVSTL